MSNVPREQINLWLNRQIPAPEPNRLLLFGYFRQHCDKELSSDIIGLLFKWYYEHEYGITYKQALDALLNKECCIGVYDFNMKIWRAGIYINHLDDEKMITIRFDDKSRMESNGYGLKIIKNFPVRCVIIDISKFNTTEKSLRNLSNVPAEKVNEWMKRKR